MLDTLDAACWAALKAAARGPLLVDLRLHPDDLLRLMANADARRVTWEPANGLEQGMRRYCGYRLLPDASVPQGRPAVVAKPE